MGLNIIERPIGVALNSGQSATIEEDYLGIATVKTNTAHGLSEDSYVYVKSYVEDYNGFWKIHFIDGFHFFLKNSDGTYVGYIVDTTATISTQSFTHGWSCTELPIVYKIKSDRYPTNSFDISRTLLAYEEQDGYLVLNLSGSLPTDTLEFLQITGSSGGFDGIYQILDMIDFETALINLKFDANFDPDLTSTITKYYSNYHAKVNVYAGLNALHTFAAIKPYELAATLSFIPDENNEIKFSINEILKSYVNLNNNLLLATYPNNLDAYTEFYIGVIESFDNSDGYTITTQESSETLDQNTFEGIAALSKLEFKNVQSGYLTDYIMNSATAKFLTLFSIPTLFTGCYQDISFIINTKRLPSPLPALSSWFNGTARGPALWTLGETPHITIAAPNQQSVILEAKITNYKAGTFYFFNYDLTITGAPVSSSRVRFFLLDESETTLATDNITISSTGDVSGTVHLFTDPIVPTRIGISVDNGTSGSIGVQVNSFVYRDATGFGYGIYNFRQAYYKENVFLSQTDTEIKPIDMGVYRMQLIENTSADQMVVSILGDGNQISEQLTIDIDDECVNQSINLTWINNLGGFEYWTFTAFKTYGVNISDSGQTTQNIFPQWPKSYGETANTINKQVFRNSKNTIMVNSQLVSVDNLEALRYIKSSPLVEIINDRFDKRRVIVDTDSFTIRQDNDKLHEISFLLTYTDEIPSQTI